MITEEIKEVDTLVKDDYANKVAPGVPFLSGKFLEPSRYDSIYKLQKKTTYFYKETVVKFSNTKRVFLFQMRNYVKFCHTTITKMHKHKLNVMIL